MKSIYVFPVVLLFLFSFSHKPGREVISCNKAPKPIGTYSQAIKCGNTVYVSGQIALDANGVLDTSSIENECRTVLQNIKAILEAGGLGLQDVNKTTIYTTDLKQFGRINEVYKTFFTALPPARETVQVSALPKGAHVEISVVAGQ